MLPRPSARKAIWICPAQGCSPSGPQVQGRHFLILGKTVDIQQTRCGIYLVRDADDIHARLWQLGGRFALLAAGIGLVGLGAVRLVISRALGPCRN